MSSPRVGRLDTPHGAGAFEVRDAYAVELDWPGDQVVTLWCPPRPGVRRFRELPRVMAMWRRTAWAGRLVPYDHRHPWLSPAWSLPFAEYAWRLSQIDAMQADLTNVPTRHAWKGGGPSPLRGGR